MNLALAAAVACLSVLSPTQDKDKLREALKDTDLVGTWIYDDLDGGIAEAKKSGKPLLVTLRCVPCVSFKTFDRQVRTREDAEGDHSMEVWRQVGALYHGSEACAERRPARSPEPSLFRTREDRATGPTREEHHEHSRAAEHAAYGAALALVAGGALPPPSSRVLLTPLAEALPWLLPGFEPAPVRDREVR